jgi:hypothetical protein
MPEEDDKVYGILIGKPEGKKQLAALHTAEVTIFKRTLKKEKI